MITINKDINKGSEGTEDCLMPIHSLCPAISRGTFVHQGASGGPVEVTNGQKHSSNSRPQANLCTVQKHVTLKVNTIQSIGPENMVQ
jgi:hypothetical protein